MAESVVGMAIETLTKLIIAEADVLIGVKDELGWFKTEFRVMVSYLESIDTRHQLPENANDWLEKTRTVIRGVEDIIETYAKRASQVYKEPYWIEKRKLGWELRRIKHEIVQVRQGWRDVDLANGSLRSSRDHLALASSSQGSGFAAMAKLDVAIQGKYYRISLQWLSDELAPLHDFLQEIDELGGVGLIRGSKKLWIQELSDIFEFVDESLANFEASRGQGVKNWLLSRFDDSILEQKLNVFASVMKVKISKLYQRYYVYWLGEIRVDNGVSSVFPRLRLTAPIRYMLESPTSLVKVDNKMDTASFLNYLPLIACLEMMISLMPKTEIETDTETEFLRGELKLMKALIDETGSMDNLDERLKVWLDQMHEISIDLEDASNIRNLGRRVFFHHIFDRVKIARKLRLDIRDLAARKMIYGVGSAMGKVVLANPFEQQTFKRLPIHPILEEIMGSLEEAFLSKSELRRRVKSLRRDHQLMQVVLEDVKRIEKLNARLKFWVEEMQGVAREANAVVELDFESINIKSRLQAARKIKQIYRHIYIMSKWKHTYDIGDVKPILGAGPFEHNLEETGPFPSTAIEEEIELTRREIKLMQALCTDIRETGELDGTAEAWVEEVRNIAEEAKKLRVRKRIASRVCIRIASRLDRVKDKIRQLSEIRIAYGIEPRTRSTADSSDASNNIVNPSVPSYLMQCVYYFLLFPTNFEVPTRRLIVLWVAEGLVRSKSVNENESVEHVAEQYLNELIELKLVCATKKKHNGKVKACQLSDGTRDEWLIKAKEARFFQDTSEMVARLIDHHGNSDSSFIQIHGNSNSSIPVSNYRNVVSFLSFDTKEGSKPGEAIGNFVRDCIAAKCFLGLRVLDLERVFRPKLPKGLSKLTRLRYIGLRWTYLETLPPYVSKLLNLQVLDVKHTYISVLPKSIWRMQYLRHLYLSETYRTRFTGRPSSVSLNQLQTLWGAFIDENTHVEQGLDTLLNIRKLGLLCTSTSTSSQQLQAVDKWISNLEFLEILRLKSKDSDGNVAELHLSPLTRNKKLSTVYLLGKLHPSVVYEFPANLTDITLSGSELGVDPMKYLEKLPKLVILRLLAQSVVCGKMHCSNGGFAELKVLGIWKLDQLEEWEVEEGAIPCLEDLEIRSCMNLKTLPDALQNVNTLQKLKLTSMPVGFVDETMARVLPELSAKITVE